MIMGELSVGELSAGELSVGELSCNPDEIPRRGDISMFNLRGSLRNAFYRNLLKFNCNKYICLILQYVRETKTFHEYVFPKKCLKNLYFF